MSDTFKPSLKTSIALILYALLLYHLTVLDMQFYLIVLISGCCVLFLGMKYPLFGLLFIFAAMNNFFNLIPDELLGRTLINKTWDFAFIIFAIFFVPLYFKRKEVFRTIKTPYYFNLFLVYLGICTFSFILTIILYPFPFMDTLRTFRYHLGYLFIPFMLLNSCQIIGDDKTFNFKKLLKSLYYISFILLALYIIQYLTQIAIFTGYSRSFSLGGQTYLRSIPGFLFICYFFFWYNIGAWFTGRKMYPGGIIYIILCFPTTLFTFTRGIYISVAFTFFFLIIILFRINRYNLIKFLFAGLIGIPLILIPFLSGYLNPFYNRAATIKKTAINMSEGTFKYRIDLLKDRIRLANKKNPLLGIGFVHNKYGQKFGKFSGNYDEETGYPSLECADIAWGNIVYRTGWLGMISFISFIICIIYYIFIKLEPAKTINSIFLIELAALLELLRNIIQMLNSNIFTGNATQNMSLLFGIALFAYSQNPKNGPIPQ